MNEPGAAVVAGHICLDVIPELGALEQGSFYDILEPGRLIETGAARLASGGPVSNAGIALHILGVPTRLVSLVGDDPFGRILRELVESYGQGLADGLSLVPGAETAYSLILSPPGADRLFLHHSGVAAYFGPEHLDYEALAQFSLFHFGYPPLLPRMYAKGGRELAEILRRVRERGVTTSLDTSYPDPASASGRADWRRVLESALPHVDVFSPSLDELVFMMRRPLFESQARHGSIANRATPGLVHELAEELIGLGVGIAAIKVGERGLYLKTGTRERIAALGRARPEDPGTWAERELWAPCFRVDVAGTTGAGDATGAGLLAALLHGLGAEQALTAAVAAGACNVEQADSLSGLRSWQETLERVRSGWQRLPLELDDPGWEWDEKSGLWTSRRDG